MNNLEYELAFRKYIGLRGKPVPKEDLESAAQKLMDAFLLKIRPRLWEFYFGNKGLAHVVVGIGKDNQPFYLGPYKTIEEMREAYQSQMDRIFYKREVQLGSLVEKGMMVVYDWLVSLFRREAVAR